MIKLLRSQNIKTRSQIQRPTASIKNFINVLKKSNLTSNIFLNIYSIFRCIYNKISQRKNE